MRIILFLCVIILNSYNLIGQRNLFNQKYDSITQDFKIEKSLLDDYRHQGKIEIFNAEKHKTKLARTLLKLKSGKTKTFDSDYYETKYEVISRQDIPHYRIRYIFIDKGKFDTPQGLENYIKKVRNLLDKTAFKSVAMQYTMDYKRGVGGDSGWFKKGKTHPEFFNEVTSSKRLAQEIFEFEIPEINGYYFVQKNWAPKDIREVLVMYNLERK